MVAKDEESKQDLILIDSCIHSLPLGAVLYHSMNNVMI